MTARVRVRHISDRDWDGIVELEAAAYPGLSEDRSALESRADASPGTCFVLAAGPRIAGYLLSLPYPEFRCPDLATKEETAFQSRNLHLHDLVIAHDLRGGGLAKRLLRRLSTAARSRGYERISLVAVGGSETFWSANGFRAHPAVRPPDGYGDGARYMSMAL